MSLNDEILDKDVSLDLAISFLVKKLSGTLRGYGALDEKVRIVAETDISRDFANAYCSGFFRMGDGSVYIFNGKKYIPLTSSKDGVDNLTQIIVATLEKLEVGNIYTSSSTVSKIRARMIAKVLPLFKPSRAIISFKNGVLDLNTEIFHDHDQKFVTTTYFDFDYDRKAKCPRWNQFLIEVLDEPQRMILQEFMGCIFIDRTQLQVSSALFLYGNGSNGKSVVSETMTGMLGDDNCTSINLDQACSGKDKDYFTALMVGKLLNFSSDMGTEDFSSGTYKAMVSREPITVRPIGKAPFTTRDMPLIAANLNNIPVITDQSNGFWRRALILVFSRTFEGNAVDTNLIYKISAEFSGVFNWVMEGRKRIIKNEGRFTYSEIAEKAKSNARNDSDSVLTFLSENYYFPKVTNSMSNPRKITISSRNMYNKYKAFCSDAGFKAKGTKTFKDSMQRGGYQYKRSVKIDSEVTSGYQIIESLPSFDELEYFDEPELSDSQIELIKEQEKMDQLPF
ncbi:putative P4-specific DNA primase [Parabacteroides phage PF672P2]|nr:putative P4-specific DNA primase [Parabacteroides phage PF672P2]